MAITYFVGSHSINVRRIFGKGAKRLPFRLVTPSPCFFWVRRHNSIVKTRHRNPTTFKVNSCLARLHALILRVGLSAFRCELGKYVFACDNFNI